MFLLLFSLILVDRLKLVGMKYFSIGTLFIVNCMIYLLLYYFRKIEALKVLVNKYRQSYIYFHFLIDSGDVTLILIYK